MYTDSLPTCAPLPSMWSPLQKSTWLAVVAWYGVLVHRCPGSTRNLLQGLHDLLFYYLPALLVQGHDVRQLTWEGGVNGTVKGDVARRVLLRSLALQVHLLDDWECRAEYTRTLSVALMQ